MCKDNVRYRPLKWLETPRIHARNSLSLHVRVYTLKFVFCDRTSIV